jgi:hypothetical protein
MTKNKRTTLMVNCKKFVLILITVFSGSLFGDIQLENNPINYVSIYEQGKEDIERLVALCSFLEKKLGDLSHRKKIRELTEKKRKQFIALIEELFPYLDGDLYSRIQVITERLKKIKARQLTKSVRKVVIGVLGLAAVAAMFYFGIQYLRSVQGERDKLRDEIVYSVRKRRELEVDNVRLNREAELRNRRNIRLERVNTGLLMNRNINMDIIHRLRQQFEG